MGLLKHFRSKSRLSDGRAQPAPTSSLPYHFRQGPDLTQRLPDKVLENIFSYVCPHTLDHTYEPCEQSQIGDGCMLCDLRDLAHCAQTCRKWYAVAQKLQFTSVRIDAVHYCALEELLVEKRKKAGGHFRSKGVVKHVDVPNMRLNLLCRTVRENPNLGAQTLFLKIPYMTRETTKADLARTVSALPNLRYVDLPDGFFSGDPSCLALRQELQARCRNIRKMSYRSGSEGAFEMLTHRQWQEIEILDLASLAIEPSTLRIVLASLPKLHELTLSDLPWMDDSIFQESLGQLPEFPALRSLNLAEIPNVTAQGLVSWLDKPHVRKELTSLLLQSTGVTVQDLHTILHDATALQELSIAETVAKSLTLAPAQLPPLSSKSLLTMHYEITSSEEVHGLQKPAESYYTYLTTSLHQNALPALKTLYVRDQTFPELLILPSVPAPFAGSDAGSVTSKPSTLSPKSSLRGHLRGGGGFNQTLEVFSKGIDEHEWVFTSVNPPAARSRTGSLSGGRPLSAYSASRGLGPQWAQGGFGGEARKSVIVSNGFGGFLAVPQEEVPRPKSADGVRWGSFGSQGTGSSEGNQMSYFKPPPSVSGESTGSYKRRSRHDLWR